MGQRLGQGTLRHSDLAMAQRLCAQAVKSHDENFTVASRILPQALRPHMAAIYAYCRAVDDLGDEFKGDRLRALDGMESAIRRLYGEGSGPTPGPSPLAPYVAEALSHTIATFDLPMEPFVHLIEANRMDQRQTAFATFGELRAYTRLSAEPVGRLVLHVFRLADEGRMRLSDETCTALQLANFWQDLGPDLARGRCYVPLEDLDRFGLTRESLGVRGDPRVERLMAMEVVRTRELFSRGALLEDLVPGRLRVQLRLYRLGGEAILASLARQGLDPFAGRPHLGSWNKAWIGLCALGIGSRRRPVTAAQPKGAPAGAGRAADERTFDGDRT